MVTTRDLLGMLGAPEHWLRGRIRSGALKPVRLGSIFIWPGPEIEKAERLFAERQRRQAACADADRDARLDRTAR